MSIVYNIFQQMESIGTPQKKFMEMLFSTILSMYGRANFRNMSRYAACHEKTFSRNYEKPFDYLEFNTIVIKQVILPEDRVVVAVDQVFVEKSGKKTYGLDKFWNGSQSCSQKGLEANGIALISLKTKTALPLLVQQTPLRTEIVHSLNNPEASRMDFYTHMMQEQLPRIQDMFPGAKHVVADAYYAKKKFVKAIQCSEFHMVGKLRSDANLRFLNVEKNEGRGRPKKYGGKVEVKDPKNFNFVQKLDDGTILYVANMYSINLEQVIKVVYLQFKTTFKLLFSTDLNLSAQEIYEIYKARFQIEFLNRDAKQHTGFMECQARSKEKIHNHLNISFSALLIVKVQEMQKNMNATQKVPFSMTSYKRRYLNEMEVNRFISIFDLDPSLIKSHPMYKSSIEHGVIRQ